MAARRGRISWRLVIVLSVLGICLMGFAAWRTATGMAELEVPNVGAPPIEGDLFLGISVDDQTRDQISSNAWLRSAMHSGHQRATPVRRYQIDRITLTDGQHPETGEPAVILLLTPKAQETPLPAFESVAIRRWKPRDKNYAGQEEIARLQRIRSPNAEDLQRLEENWSGRQLAQADALIAGLYRLLFFTAVGIGFILVAGAYRSFQSMSTKWDSSLVDQHKSRVALQKLRTIRGEREVQQQLDNAG